MSRLITVKMLRGQPRYATCRFHPTRPHPDRCLFLDFGSSGQVSSLTQTKYGIHQYLFIAEFSGPTLAWYQCPPSEANWDYPEWSNTPRFAVASCRNDGGDAHAVYCVNLDNHTDLQLIEGTELENPYLWIGASFDLILWAGLSPDSLGVYNDPFLNGNQIPFSFKMKKFWEMHQSLDAVFVGSSQVLCGIDCAAMKDYSSVNLGYASVGVTTCANIICDYILPACPKVRCIGMSSAVYWLDNTGAEGDDTWQSAITQTKGYQYDSHHNFWRGGFPAHFDDCIAAASCFSDTHCDTLGMSTDSCGNWGGDNPDLGGGANWDWPITDTNYINNFNAIVALIQDLAKRNIHLLMINFPESPAYKNTNHYTRDMPLMGNGYGRGTTIGIVTNNLSEFSFL